METIKQNEEPQPTQKTTPPDDAAIQKLVEIMRMVDLDDPDAKLNATTISDGKGGRILL